MPVTPPHIPASEEQTVDNSDTAVTPSGVSRNPVTPPGVTEAPVNHEPDEHEQISEENPPETTEPAEVPETPSPVVLRRSGRESKQPDRLNISKDGQKSKSYSTMIFYNRNATGSVP